MSLRQFVPDDDVGAALVVTGGEQPRPLQDLLDEAFPDRAVTVEECAGAGDDAEVLLVRDGAVRARSPLRSLQETILLVNSDLYTTGSVGLEELEVPEVVAALDDIPFSLRGYPEAAKEKLLLIVISRRIEQLAWEGGAGTLRSSFQRLSRIDDERGTRRVYETLAGTDVDVHVYGLPDWQPPESFGVTAHGGHTDDFRYGWFVVYTPPDGHDGAALVAYETEAGRWEGVWTYDPERIGEIERYIQRTM